MDNLFTSCCAGVYVAPEESKQETRVLEKTATEKVAECQSRYNVSDSKVEEYQESFYMLDRNGNGTLNTTELEMPCIFGVRNPRHMRFRV